MQHLVEAFDVPAYSVRVDGDDLILDAWNRASELAFRRAAKEVIGRPVYDAVHPLLEESTRLRRIANLRRREWWTGATTLRDRDGLPISFRGMCWSVPLRGERHFVTVLRFAELARVRFTNRSPQIAQMTDRRDLSQIAGSPFADLAYMPQSGNDSRGHLVQASNAVNAAAEDLAATYRRLFGRRLRRARKEAGRTQEELAADVSKVLGTHTTQRDISRWESGTHIPRPGPIALAQALGKPPDFFDGLTGDDGDDE